MIRIKTAMKKSAAKNANPALNGAKLLGIPWSPWLAVIMVIVAFLVSTMLAQVLLSIYPALHHWSAARAQDWADNSTWAQFGYTLLAYGILAGSLLGFVRWRGVSLATLGLKRPKWRHVLSGAAVWPLYFAAYFVLVTVVSILVPSLNISQKQQIGFSATSGFGPLLLTYVSLAVIPPLVEETVMRGFLYTSLRNKLSLVLAALITSVLFAAGHLQFGSGAPLLWIAAIDTFILSLFLVYLREKTGNLWASITLHALKNTIAFMSIFIFHWS